jgi:predicted dehydrogenase
LKIGVVGLGRWGTKVTREYISLMNERVIDSVILCDIDAHRLKSFAGEAIICSEVKEVLSKVDGIHVCTPNSTHYKITKMALDFGVHVLVEKPMTMDSNEAYDLVETAASRNLILQVGYIYRFANVIRRLKEFYKSNYFGTPYYFGLTWTHQMPYIDDVDILWDLLPHPLDILNFITEKWPIEFIGVNKAFRRDKLGEVASLQAIYNDGIFASIHLSWLCPIRRRTLEIVGSRRAALVDCVKQEIEIWEQEEKIMLEVKANNTIRDEILNFLNAVKTGRNTFNSSIVGARNVEMVEKAIKSLRFCP